MPLTFTVTFKPTPSIALPQDTVDLSRMENCTVAVTGRHDPCIALRAAPIVEAAAALALWRVLDPRGGDLKSLRLQLDGMPHGFGAQGDWIPTYDQWLTTVFSQTS